MEYYLCSQEVIDHLTPEIVSLPFKSGYKHDHDLYYIASFESKDANDYYNEVIEPFNEKSRKYCDFWFRSCEPGFMDVSTIYLEDCYEYGIFKTIEIETGFTNETNRALVIANLANENSCDPIKLIELINNYGI